MYHTSNLKIQTPNVAAPDAAFVSALELLYNDEEYIKSPPDNTIP